MIILCGSQAQISTKKRRFAPKISSDIRSAAGELFIGPSQSLPEMSDGPTAIGEHCQGCATKHFNNGIVVFF